MGLEGRVAVVTGASSGIGREIAVELSRRGATVVVNYIDNFTDAQETLRRVKKGFGYPADISDAMQVQEMVQAVITIYGRIDILVNNAAILLPNDDPWIRHDLYDAMYKVNVQGAINCIDTVVPHMQERQHGRIVNIASVRGVRESDSNREYARTKQVLLSKTRELAVALAPHITVNAVSPGIIHAPMVKDMKASDERLRSESLACRIGRPEEIAHAVVFLADDNAGYITGQNIIVDGGYLQKTR